VAHGNLTVTVNSTPQVSQPNALAGGQTVVAEKATSPSPSRVGR
jgi:flagellar P-ring protein precursor FlgI